MKKFINILIYSIFIVSCAYSVPIKPTVSPVAYEFTEKKIEGDVALFVDGDPTKLNQVVRPRSFTGAACYFPVEVGDSLKVSIERVANSYFTNVTRIDNLPKDKTNFDGILRAKLTDCNIDLTWLGQAGTAVDAFAEMNVKLTFYDSDLKPVWASMVGHSKRVSVTATFTGGCRDALEPISSAIEGCLKQITLQMAEKISYSEEIKETCKVGRKEGNSRLAKADSMVVPKSHKMKPAPVVPPAASSGDYQARLGEKQLIEKDKQKLAYVPKTTTATRLSLRKEPLKLLERDIRRMVLTYDFYDEDLNWQGSFANDFVDNGDGTVTDRATGLMWQKSGSSRTTMWKRARTYVKRLNKGFAGYSDWRLPTIEELASLLRKDENNGIHTDPLFDTKQKTCWSSDKGPPFGGLTSNPPQVWHVNFREGSLGLTVLPTFPDAPPTHRYVRAVRSLR
jgi:hypothetical protein